MTISLAKRFDFTSTVNSLKINIKGLNKEKSDLEALAREKGNQANKEREEMFYFVELAKMAGYTSTENKWWAWYTGEMNGERSGNHTAWSQYHYFRMVGYEFSIGICERSDLKRDKFQVALSGRRLEASAGNSSVSSYNNYDYIKDKYKDIELNLKFRTLEEANKQVEYFKNLLINDHREELDKQLEMIKSITPEEIAYANNIRYI